VVFLSAPSAAGFKIILSFCHTARLSNNYKLFYILIFSLKASGKLNYYATQGWVTMGK
jgi:hypothetical protein